MHLLLDDNIFTGMLPPSLGTSPQLTDFWVMKNKLTGPIPASVGQSSVLGSVDFSGNSLTGTIPEFLPSSQMQFLSLDNNNLNGSIPSSIGNLHILKGIWLANTTLEGTIPTELAQCLNLKYVSFELNQLTGDIGPVINTLPRSLMQLDLDTNLLSGTVPTSIGMLTNLDFLDLGDNNLNGTIPTELGLLSNLEVLDLYSNRFNGTVPASLASLPLSKSHRHSCSNTLLPLWILTCGHPSHYSMVAAL
jgi:Leucine-rich repeat (LRR) protein